MIKASIDGTQVCPSLGVRSGKFTGDAHGSVDTTLEALRAELFLMIAKFYRTDPAATSFPDPETAALESSPGAAHRAFAAIDKSVSEGLPAMRLCMQDLQEEVAQKLGLAVDPETGLTESIESGEKRQRALRANSVRVHSLIYAAERYLGAGPEDLPRRAALTPGAIIALVDWNRTPTTEVWALLFVDWITKEKYVMGVMGVYKKTFSAVLRKFWVDILEEVYRLRPVEACKCIKRYINNQTKQS